MERNNLKVTDYLMYLFSMVRADTRCAAAPVNFGQWVQGQVHLSFGIYYEDPGIGCSPDLVGIFSNTFHLPQK